MTLEPVGRGGGSRSAHLAAERARLAGLTFERFDVRQQEATIGAEVSGLDLCRPLDDATVAELRTALAEFKVLFFRDQPLTPAEHVAFARRFGELEVHPFIPANPEQPELVRFEKEATVGGYENGWHSDVSWRARPSLGAVLHAVEVPPVGGDTLFADMCAAYDGLDADLQERIAGLVAVHDFSKVFGHTVKAERTAPPCGSSIPPVEHPVVRTHPETGRKLLFVNRFFVDRIVGLDRDESDALIDRLARRPRRSSTSAASAGSRTRSPSGTTGRCSTTRRATTGRSGGSWSGPASWGSDPVLTAGRVTRHGIGLCHGAGSAGRRVRRTRRSWRTTDGLRSRHWRTWSGCSKPRPTLRSDLVEHEEVCREIIAGIRSGGALASVLEGAHSAKLRPKLTESLGAYERIRHEARLRLVALGAAEGMTTADVQRYWSVTCQLASRALRQARGLDGGADALRWCDVPGGRSRGPVGLHGGGRARPGPPTCPLDLLEALALRLGHVPAHEPEGDRAEAGEHPEDPGRGDQVDQGEEELGRPARRRTSWPRWPRPPPCPARGTG